MSSLKKGLHGEVTTSCNYLQGNCTNERKGLVSPSSEIARAEPRPTAERSTKAISQKSLVAKKHWTADRALRGRKTGSVTEVRD